MGHSGLLCEYCWSLWVIMGNCTSLWLREAHNGSYNGLADPVDVHYLEELLIFEIFEIHLIF